MRKPHKIYDDFGSLEHGNFGSLDEVTQLGDYDLLREENGRMAVACPPDLRRVGCWNITEIVLADDGNIIFVDDDVQPDPYHMCRIYQALAELEKGEKS